MYVNRRYLRGSAPLAFAAFFALALSGNSAAWAQTTGDAVDAQPTTPKVRITKKDCHRLLRQQARADVAYKPGVDVRGKKVVGADLNGGFTIPLPDVFEFNVTKDLSAYLGGAEEKLAADKAAAIAAERSVAATNAAVSSAELSLEGAQSVYDTAVANATAAQTAADAAPNDAALASVAEAAQTAATTAKNGLATTQLAYNATQSAATTDNVSDALTNAQAALTSAKAIGYTPDATATEAATTATQAAQDAAEADAAALDAAETVAKSEGMTLNVGTVRFNINTGTMTFNGQPLTDTSETELAAQCRAMLSAQ